MTADMETTNLGVDPAEVKVPRITPWFWAIKILSTAGGEALADYVFFDLQLDITVGVVIEFVLFAGALVLQLTRRRYVPPVYWFAVLMVAVFGTTVADDIDYIIGVPLPISTGVFLLLTVLAFAFWRWRARTLSIHTITSGSGEGYYWLTVFLTFILGTAAGDLFAGGLGLGFLVSGFIFTGMMLITAAGFRLFHWNAIACFWIAYVLTRPVGASFADWFGMAKKDGGLGIGAGPVALFLVVAIAALVTLVTIRKLDRQRAGALSADPS